MPRALLILMALLVWSSSAAAQTLPGHPSKACGFTGTPSSVVVDVYSDASPGSVLATAPNADVTRIGTTDCYQIELGESTIAEDIEYPTLVSPARKSYSVAFRDDAGNLEVLDEIAGFSVAQEGSPACERQTFYYAASPIIERGITQQVIDRNLVSYSRVDVSCSHDFDAPDSTYFLVFRYNARTGVSSATPSATPPNP